MQPQACCVRFPPSAGKTVRLSGAAPHSACAHKVARNLCHYPVGWLQVADFFSYVQRVQQQLGLEAHRPKGLQPRGAAAAGGMDMGAGGLPGMSNWAAEDAAIANLLEARWDLTRKNFLSRADAQREAQMQMIREMDALVKGLSTGRQAALAGFQG